MIGGFGYSVFGLIVRSEMELPELFRARDDQVPDVEIRIDASKEPESVPGLTVQGDALLLNIPGVARYHISGGREIVIEPAANAPERNVRLFLLGSAFGALLHQRGLLPLHANAVEINGRAVAFMGESGAGKSTLAAWFHDRGHRIVADDICVIQFASDGRALAMPGVPRLRLWQDALVASGRSTAELQRSYLSDEEEKYEFPVDQSWVVQEPIELAAIFEIGRGQSWRVEPLAGVEATEAIYGHTYRGAFVDLTDTAESFWLRAVKLVRSVPVFRLHRVWGLEAMNDQFQTLIDGALLSLADDGHALSSSRSPCA